MASPYWFYLSDNEEIGDLPVQDHQHTQRRDILHAETEEIIDPRTVLAVEEDLLNVIAGVAEDDAAVRLSLPNQLVVGVFQKVFKVDQMLQIFQMFPLPS